MKTFPTKQAALILVLFILVGGSIFAAYQTVIVLPARQIIHAYMDAKGIDIRPGTQEYKLFMRQIVWGEFPELRQISDFVKTQEELDAVSRYAFKYSGYQKLYGKYRGTELPEVKAPPAMPTASQTLSLVMPTATTLEETPLNLGTPSPTVPKATATPKPKPTEIIYLTAMGAIDVYRAADIRFEIVRQLLAGQTFVVFGRLGDWYWIDLGDGKTGWVYGVTDLIQFSVEQAQIPALDFPTPHFMTSTPFCAPRSVPDVEQALDDAQSVLVAFFDLLNKKEYARAIEFYGGDYGVLRDNNRSVDPNDYVTLFQHACEINGFQCLQVKRVVNRKAILPYQYEFIVEFKWPDGSLFVRGPCCGADETQQPPVWRWKYTVFLECTGQYLVEELPPYIP